MKYMLAIYGDESAQENAPPEAQEQNMQAWFKYDEELRGAVEVVDGSALHPTSTATTVRHLNGKLVTSDGPFAETKEQLGGYYVIEAEDLDQALEWAGKMPSLPFGGSVEVRALQVFEQ